MKEGEVLTFLYDFYRDGEEIECRGIVDYIPSSGLGLIGFNDCYPIGKPYLSIQPCFVMHHKVNMPKEDQTDRITENNIDYIKGLLHEKIYNMNEDIKKYSIILGNYIMSPDFCDEKVSKKQAENILVLSGDTLRLTREVLQKLNSKGNDIVKL